MYYMCKASGINLDFAPTRDLVADLQEMHDNCLDDQDFVAYVKRHAKVIAAKHSLTPVTF